MQSGCSPCAHFTPHRLQQFGCSKGTDGNRSIVSPSLPNFIASHARAETSPVTIWQELCRGLSSPTSAMPVMLFWQPGSPVCASGPPHHVAAVCASARQGFYRASAPFAPDGNLLSFLLRRALSAALWTTTTSPQSAETFLCRTNS